MNLDFNSISQKCRTQQRYDKRPGAVKIFSPTEIFKYVNRLEKLRLKRENVKPKRTVKMPRQMRRHCGPNPRKNYNF
jgi:hypothetical protein